MSISPGTATIADPPLSQFNDPATATSSSAVSPVLQTYLARRDRFAAERDALTRRWNRLANLRLVAFLAALGLVIWAIASDIWWPLAPAGIAFIAFVAFVRRHRQVGRVRSRAATLTDLNDEAERRFRRAWADLPLRHAFRAAPDHPYAGDLDLFGRASVFHLLETIETAMGKTRLRGWLLAAAPLPEIRARQAAVAELAPLLDWRQEFVQLGRQSGEERPDPSGFLQWAESEPLLKGKQWLVWAARASLALLLTTAILHLTGVIAAPLWVPFILLNVLLTQVFARGADGPIEMAATQHRSLLSYADLIAHLNTLSPQSPRLTELRARLTTGGTPAETRIAQLHRLTAWAVPAGHLVHLPLQAFFAWDIHVLAALEGWQRVSGPFVRDWLETIGDTEALTALAGLAHDEPEWTFPEIDETATALTGQAVGHPLLSDAIRVVNDVEIGPPGTFLLITGSNMSGKSTLLRSIGVNIVLAGAGAPVCASSLRMPPVALWTSVRVQDSLEQGVSFFMAELLRLKQIVDAARDQQASPDAPRLFYLLDEILQGTNTAERQIAARRIIRGLVDRGAIGAVSTHDLDLPEGPELSEIAQLAHFRDTVGGTLDEPTMGFDYILRPGLATSTNALRLMELVGFDLPGIGSGLPRTSR